MNVKKIFLIAIFTASGVDYALAASPRIITMTLQNLRNAGEGACYYTWAIENNSSDDFTNMAINFTPYDGQGYALQNEYVSRLRLTPYGKAKVEKITTGGSCNQVKGIRIEGFNDLTEANGGYIDINSFKVFKFIFDGKPFNVKEIK